MKIYVFFVFYPPNKEKAQNMSQIYVTLWYGIDIFSENRSQP